MVHGSWTAAYYTLRDSCPTAYYMVRGSCPTAYYMVRGSCRKRIIHYVAVGQLPYNILALKQLPRTI